MCCLAPSISLLERRLCSSFRFVLLIREYDVSIKYSRSLGDFQSKPSKEKRKIKEKRERGEMNDEFPFDMFQFLVNICPRGA